jgi:hypothetical protein
MRHLRALRRALTGLSVHEWIDVIAAQVALLVAQFRVHTEPTGSLAADLSVAPPAAEQETDATPPVCREARQLARAIRRAADHGIFRPKCLARSVALHQMLERRGVTGSRIRVGVRMNEGRFEAHAWVELNGCVLGDRAARTSAFTHLADVRPVHG